MIYPGCFRNLCLKDALRPKGVLFRPEDLPIWQNSWGVFFDKRFLSEVGKEDG